MRGGRRVSKRGDDERVGVSEITGHGRECARAIADLRRVEIVDDDEDAAGAVGRRRRAKVAGATRSVHDVRAPSMHAACELTDQMRLADARRSRQHRPVGAVRERARPELFEPVQVGGAAPRGGSRAEQLCLRKGWRLGTSEDAFKGGRERRPPADRDAASAG